ncbi:3',5'-cyclic-nucleotide phosphodiesterase [Acinetobacter sp. WCHAc060033]|uniref:metallophosphoesterase family protein n=1 Tax=Acinetobacter sp. WCHAc060033 TaxID=2518624 RepID=UPI001023EC33|nr:metallophosphoesterase [Acinetobacter sp. WCHAc060033]RZG86209.1 3',5'-cyclic-nucleotide phosphodiesterase [Acinetobacter sp. WCHAc060033]
MLLHLSDLHFGTERIECIRAIEKFCTLHQPEVVVVSGDLTQRAKFKEFFACKQFLESLKIPYFVVPGNHDIPLYHLWNRAFRPFGLYQLFFGSLESTLSTEHFYLIGINSIRRRYHTRGSISVEQIQHVNQQLENAPLDKFKIIVSHQPFYTTNDDHHLKDCPALGQFAIKEWGQHQLFALLHGHLHLVAVYDLNKEFKLNLNDPFYEVHAGTAISSRLHKNMPNSFNVIHHDGTFQHYFFDEQLQEFVARESSPD